MLKRNISLILIILLTLLLIAIVIWFYNERIENIGNKMRPVTTSGNTSIYSNF